MSSAAPMGDHTSEIEAAEERDQLIECRNLFSMAYDHHYEWFDEVETDEEFYHSKQWSPQDVEYLRQQRRPALTFNILQTKVAHMLGAAADNDVTPTITPNGSKGQFLSETLNKILEELVEQLDLAMLDEEAFESGAVLGIGHQAVDAIPDPENPNYVKITIDRPHAIEVLWDPASERKDRSDARFLCWSRFMSRSEFKAAYPEKAHRANEIFAQYAGGADPFSDGRTDTQVQASPNRDRYVDGLHRYWNDKTREIRVVRLEMKRAERVTYVVGPDGQKRRINPESKKIIAQRSDADLYHYIDSWVDRVYWYEFIGSEMLFASESPVPFSGFSVSSWIYAQDEAKLPYAIVRLLRDPQREVNKRYSQMLNLILSQNAPGIIAEEDSFVDERQAQEALKTPAGIAIAKSGAVSGGKIQQRQLPGFPEAVARLQEIGMQMIDIISNIHVDDLMEPRGIPEAAATAQLKHRRGLLTMKPVLGRFHRMKRQVATKILETVIASFPNDQILELLADEEMYAMEGRVVLNKETEETADLSSIRDVGARIRFEPADENNTQRMLEQQSLMILIQAGVPVDPSVIFDMLGLPDAVKDRLKRYAKMMGESAAKTQQEQFAQVQQQMQMDYQLDLENAKTKREREQAKTKLSAAQAGLEFQTRLLDLWVKAEDNEKSRVADLLSNLITERTNRIQIAEDAAARSAQQSAQGGQRVEAQEV